MSSIELSNDVLAENKAHTSVVVSPSLNIKLWVRPEQVAEKSSIGHVLRSSLLVDAFEIIQVWTETTMHA